VNSPTTIDLRDKDLIHSVSSSVPGCDYVDQQQVRAHSFQRTAVVVGLALSLYLQTPSAITDPWLLEDKMRETTVTASVYNEKTENIDNKKLGRYISRREAIQLSRSILQKAEQERLALAELEAKQGIQWEDDNDL
jgi:hypothetical protein